MSSFAELAKEFNIQKPDVRARPVWLNPGETFAVSGGVGFSGGEQAIGATGVVRIEGSTSAFAGAAVTTDGKWSGKAGVRIGW